MLWKLLSVFIGGGIGSMLRFLVNEVFEKRLFRESHFSTLSVNIIGCFILGFLFFLFLNKTDINPNLRLFLTVGFCGGLTTFSTFALEVVNLHQGTEGFSAFTYLIASLVLCILATIAGGWIAKLI